MYDVHPQKQFFFVKLKTWKIKTASRIITIKIELRTFFSYSKDDFPYKHTLIAILSYSDVSKFWIVNPKVDHHTILGWYSEQISVKIRKTYVIANDFMINICIKTQV